MKCRPFIFFFHVALVCAPVLAEADTEFTSGKQTQLPYTTATSKELNWQEDILGLQKTHPRHEIAGRSMLPEIPTADLKSTDLKRRAVALSSANTLSHLSFFDRRFGRVQKKDGSIAFFIPQTVLVKFRDDDHVSALRVEANEEVKATEILSTRSDVEFAELDAVQERQFAPNDPQFGTQWHHNLIGSPQAWDKSLGKSSVRIAIVDMPFQMNHPDLAANVVAGWDVVDNEPVTGSSGIVHSTMCAGMAAAVINNGTGVAGAGNCSILPINVNGAISEIHDAIIWAADHDVRVVSVSWTGADSPTLEEAALYLKNKTRGIVVMAGVNGTGFLDYTNQPDIYCISMTDAADNSRSRYGNHIDFAAPGYQIFSTTTNSGYGFDSGTSYATPLFAGVAATVFSINPTLGAEEVIDILKTTAVDLGNPGWDQFYGWGRINFGAAANKAAQTLPLITDVSRTNGYVTVTAQVQSGLIYSLWKTLSLAPTNWFWVSNAVVATNINQITFIDPAEFSGKAYYRVKGDVSEP